MGIYSEFPHEDRSGKITYEHYTSLERIPTSSVLLRVDYSSIDDNGLFISVNDKDPRIAKNAYEEPPVYEEQTYATPYYLTTQPERDLFEYRKERGLEHPLSVALEHIYKGITN